MLVVDAANVIGSRPDGWWRDRAGAARRLHQRLAAAELGLVVLVVEGAARTGVPPEESHGVRVVHAPASGDDAVVAAVVDAVRDPAGDVIVVTSDRELRRRVEALGASTVGPSWLWDRLPDPVPDQQPG